MKTVLFIFLVLTSLTMFKGCNGNIIPIVQDVCEITLDICNYANLLCDQFDPEVLSKSEQEEIKIELSKIRDQLKSQLQTMKIEANNNLKSKESYLYIVDRLKDSVNRITNKVDQYAIE